MALQTSTPNNIRTIDGNGLAVFLQADGQIYLKDTRGATQLLSDFISGGGATPTFQQVITAGNTATSPDTLSYMTVNLGDNGAGLVDIYKESDTKWSEITLSVSQVFLGGSNVTQYGQIDITDGIITLSQADSTGTFFNNVTFAPPTDNRSIVFPDSSGTIALLGQTENIYNADGEISDATRNVDLANNNLLFLRDDNNTVPMYQFDASATNPFIQRNLFTDAGLTHALEYNYAGTDYSGWGYSLQRGGGTHRQYVDAYMDETISYFDLYINSNGLTTNLYLEPLLASIDTRDNVGFFNSALVITPQNIQLNVEDETTFDFAQIDIYTTYVELTGDTVKFTLPTPPSIGQALVAVDVDGNVEWGTMSGGAFEVIDEGNGNGIVIAGRTVANFGNVGQFANDFSYSSGASATRGATGQYAVVAGGLDHIASGTYSTIAGGRSNEATATYTSIGGGQSNDAVLDYATVSGGSANLARALNSTIGGGNNNIVEFFADYGTISGGRQNQVTGQYGTVIGGYGNGSLGDYSTVIGGDECTAYSYGEIVGGVFPTTYAPVNANGFDAGDRLFNIGGGTSGVTRADFFTILKNNKVGIGISNFQTTTSTALLQVNGAVQTLGYTVATLPVGTQGMRAFVTNANATTFNSVVAGGGANVVPVFFNGTNWVIG